MAPGRSIGVALLCVYVGTLGFGSPGAAAAQSRRDWLGTEPGHAGSSSGLERVETPAPAAASPPDPTRPLGASTPSPWLGFGSARVAASVLPAVTNVGGLCVCDLLVAQCDANCCCDPDCSASDFSVFSTCSVPVVASDSRLCSQTIAQYSINVTKSIPERVVQLVDQVNPNVFCIYSTNYQPTLSFTSPELPTESNFDTLVNKFKAASFSTDTVGMSGTSTAGRYEYGAPIQTADSFLIFPAPLVLSQCTDHSPAGFLLNQDVMCSRNIKVEDCNISALNLVTYSQVSILEAPNSSRMVPFTVQSITVTSLNGTVSRLNSTFAVPEYNQTTGVCRNIVLGVNYLITYTEVGVITNASVSFTLGAINSALVPVQQTFRIHFRQENTNPVPLSGNPGYVVGQPVVAGFRPVGSGIIQSTNRYGQLTILQSSTNQDCLAVEGNRTPVLFGYNMVSGCQLRNAFSNCDLMAETIKKVLWGQNVPEYVASFGNSQAPNVADWVAINRINTVPEACQVPVALEIEVKWNKYGSFVNPQATIESVTERTRYASLQAGSGSIYQISSLVTFVDISAPAQPGYKAQPSFDAKLPFDFFYPFV